MQSLSWLSCRIPCDQSRLRLVCFPCAGGGTSPYFAWPESFRNVVEVHTVQMPGRERRRGELLLTSFEELLKQLVPAIHALTDRPLVFFGHSMGALVAFEVARQLQKESQFELAHLFVAARLPPHTVSPPLHHLSDDQLVAFLDSRYGGVPDAIRNDPDLMQFFLPIIRADLAVLASHVWHEESPLTCPITAMGGLRDLSTSEPVLAQWQTHTTGPFALKLYSGDHFFPHKQREAVITDILTTINASNSSPPA